MQKLNDGVIFMILFDKDNKRFNFRVAALAIHNNKVLLHRYENFDFWALPGGRAELQENTKETILRELKEELDEEVVVERLLWCCESFFNHMNKDVHELGFYYLVKFKEDSPLLHIEEEFEKLELDGSKMFFKWIPLDEVDNLKIMPAFIKQKITKLSNEIEHIIIRD